MSVDEGFPPAPEALMAQSDDWAFDRVVDGFRDGLEAYTLGAYYKAFGIYQHHREALLERIDTAGGVKKVEYVGLDEYREPYVNQMICKDGTTIPVSELVCMEPIVDTLVAPPGLPKSTTRTHEIQITYGGKHVGRNAEDTDRIDLKFLRGARPFDVFLEDPTYFPEDMGITERVVTDLNLPYDSSKQDIKPHVASQSFSLDGKIWRPQFIYDPASFPDPRLDPLGYRRWALAGDARLEISFQAPATVIGKNRWNGLPTEYVGMKTLISQGRVITEKSTIKPAGVIEAFQYYLKLLDFCYVHYVPEEERVVIDEEVSQLLPPGETLALTTGNEKQ